MSSHPDIFLGATLKTKIGDRHYCVVISDPDQTDGEVVLVTLTQVRERWEDHCVLTAEDYRLLYKDTVPAYRSAFAGPASALQASISSFEIAEPVPEACLLKIIEGARLSSEMPRKFKRLLP